MKKELIKTLTGDLVFLVLLIFCVSRLHYICEYGPLIAFIIPALWFLYGLVFLGRRNSYKEIIKEKVFTKCSILCMLMGIFSLLYVIGIFIKRK